LGIESTYIQTNLSR